MEIYLKKGQYFNHGEKYFVEFKYGSKDQQDKMFELFENALMQTYGSNSKRALEDNDYIMPYFVDEKG